MTTKKVSSNEISVWFKSYEPELSLDPLSKRLCSPEGVELAENFEKIYVPLWEEFYLKKSFFTFRAYPFIYSHDKAHQFLRINCMEFNKFMGKIKHLNKKKLETICNRLWDVSGGLKGIGALLEQQHRDPCYEGDEMFGLGQLLNQLSNELSILEDILRCGYDSRAVKNDDP